MNNDNPSFFTAVSNGFDPSFYINIYKDVEKVYGKSASCEVLLKHYLDYGIAGGRVPSKKALKENLSDRIIKTGSILEIGPFTNPLVMGHNVKYFDVLDREGLENRAFEKTRPVTNAVDIDFVDPNGDLSTVDLKFDSIVSSHCIEHQPDLVKHLQDVENILNPNGTYYVVCPDKRYCFDHFVTETNTIDVLVAHREGRKIHSLHKVVENRTIVTHNDPHRHWDGDHGRPHYLGHGKAPIENAMIEYERANNSYIDVHAWQFNPVGFHKLISELNDFGYIKLYVDEIFPTPRNRLEFIVALKCKAA